MSHINIRQLTFEDLRYADALRQAEGWNQTHRDWERLLTHQPEGCFLAEWNGESAGVVTTTIHGGELGWIGMMLVHPIFRRRGIATALIERCLNYLEQQQVQCIKLDATPAGTPVYECLGFRTEWSWQRRARLSDLTPEIKTSGRETMPEYPWDHEVFGANRDIWLARVVRDSRVICLEDGFAMLRQGARAGYLGPIVALNAETAEHMIRQLLTGQQGDFLWDLPAQNQHGIELAELFGFEVVRDLNRMWTGNRLIAGIPEYQYGYSDPGTG
ncbi:MAG: GNAT family N-acetyltransferase [Planctomycetaceae bacterium]|nr:GNAT family N-acetyltransferase [Planctomycetaceae bacterium]